MIDDELEQLAFEIVQIPGKELGREGLAVRLEQHGDEDGTGRHSQRGHTAQMIVDPGPGIAGFNLADPAHAEAGPLREFGLGKALASAFILDSPA